MGKLVIYGTAQKDFFPNNPLEIVSYSGNYEIEENGYVRFKTSGVLIVKRHTVIDVFLVGGGGAGAPCQFTTSSTLNQSCGGGGGYTKTRKKVRLFPNIEYRIEIGSGGEYSRTGLKGERGGTSFAFGEQAEGGYGGTYQSSSTEPKGGDGGSGGGGRSTYSDSTNYKTVINGGTDGSDGQGGLTGINTFGDDYGKGQGVTTRAFDEAEGELFANGGRGGAYVPGSLNSAYLPRTSGYKNTGNGGDGAVKHGSSSSSAMTVAPGSSGKSGIVIIREAVS